MTDEDAPFCESCGIEHGYCGCCGDPLDAVALCRYCDPPDGTCPRCKANRETEGDDPS